MTQTIDLSKYKDFVTGVTSDESMYIEKFVDRIYNLENEGSVNAPRLLTASMGLSSESGEFNEIVKKLFFHGKDLTEDEQYHMQRELGDIIWYWISACAALGFDPDEIIAMNVEKLEARYPGGKFSAFHSDNRAKGDI